jgi:hypothetical protein
MSNYQNYLHDITFNKNETLIESSFMTLIVPEDTVPLTFQNE